MNPTVQLIGFLKIRVVLLLQKARKRRLVSVSQVSGSEKVSRKAMEIASNLRLDARFTQKKYLTAFTERT
jgi:hypothetical protein